MRNYLLVAGEASSDLIGSWLVREIKNKEGATFFGVAGNNCAAEGVELLHKSSELSILGLDGWWRELSRIFRIKKNLLENCKRRRVDAAILVDLPDFNLSLSRGLKRLGIPVYYYSSPQIWVWRKYRIHKIKKYIHKMIVLFPFEKEIYENNGINVFFAGHPLMDFFHPRVEVHSPERVSQAPCIAVLPGSRKSEIEMYGPALIESLTQLKSRYPNCRIQIPISPTLEPDWIKGKIPLPWVEWKSESAKVLSDADLAVLASGTATLEAALLGIPSVVLCQTTPLTAFFLKNISRYQGFFALPNIILKHEVFRELKQEEVTPQNIFNEVESLIQNQQKRTQIQKDLFNCRQALSIGEQFRCSEAAAMAILSDFESV